MEQDAWMDSQDSSVSMAKERYEFFMRPEPRENLGPIEEVDDSVTGRRIKTRLVRMGMTRNAKEENRSEVLAYLEPFPHIRIDTAKPLQGWYKSLHEPDGVRARPCFSEAILTEPYGGYCLPLGSLVETPNGSIPIENLKPGDWVLGQTDKVVATPVLATVVRKASCILEVETVDGEVIRLTPEHPLFSTTRFDYVRADEVKLGEKIETRSLSVMREVLRERQMGELVEVLPRASVFDRTHVFSGVEKIGEDNLDLFQKGLRTSLRRWEQFAMQGTRNRGSNQSREDAERGYRTVSKRSTQDGRGTEKVINSSEGEEAFIGYQSSMRGASSVRNNREEVVSKVSVYLSIGESISPTVLMGERSSYLVRFSTIGLGLRTGDNSPKEWRLLPPRLSFERRKLYRGQRVFGSQRPIQDTKSKEVRVQDTPIRRKEVEETGIEIKAIRRVVGEVLVADIQTGTSNFYTVGSKGLKAFHIHNCAVGCQFCVLPGQEVETPNGPRLIETLKVGDLVWGRNGRGIQLSEILSTNIRKVCRYVEVILSDGRELKVTDNHPMYSLSRGWVRADSIQIGEELEHGEERVLPGLWGSDKTVSETLRRMFEEIPYTQRPIQKGNDLYSYRSYEGQNVGYGFEESKEYESASKRSQVSEIPSGKSGVSTTRTTRLQAIQTSELYRQEGADISYEIAVGGSNRPIFRPTEIKLGLRTFRDTNLYYGVFTRLCIEVGNDYRGQRVYGSTVESQDRGSEAVRVSSRNIRPETPGAFRHATVSQIVFKEEAAEVHDLETTTGNFYLRGVLQKNCYINSGFRGYRGTGLITVPLNYGQQIRKQLSKMYVGAAGYFSSFTDPFTPLESYYHNTEEAAREFVEVGLPIFFLSRLKYPDWSIELLQQNRHSYAQKSLNTSDPKDWQLLSPGALGLKEHLADITRLKKAGIYISIQCNPILPGITSHKQVETLFKMLKEAGADHVIVKFVEAGYSWAPAMVDRIKKRFGEQRGEAFEALFTENIGGQRTIHEDYRLPAHERYAAAAKRLGLTYATCYEYRKERDESGNVVNSTGVSIGREFTTAEQCHGQRVPVYQRDTLDEPFHEVEACPPSGCLYCAEENGGEARCGSDLLGEASAMRAADYKKPLLQIG